MTEETIKHLGRVKVGQSHYDLYLMGMAVAGDEFQIIIRDCLGVVKAVVFVHEGGKDFTWINPPLEEYRKLFEREIKKLIGKLR